LETDDARHSQTKDFEVLLASVHACTLCAHELEPRPVLRLHPRSRVLVIGQAPGSRVHASGKPWDDPSGDHLCSWLGVDRQTFDDPRRFGILPMGFCYPGKGKSADLPPPPRCAETWHASLRAHLPEVRLVLLVGSYAQKRYLGKANKRTLTETVRAWESFGLLLPLPHPSWRSKHWMKKQPWFEAEVLPQLRRLVIAACADLPD